MIVLLDSENRMIVSSFIWTKHRNVTERPTGRRMDRQICCGYYSGLHCKWRQNCNKAIRVRSNSGAGKCVSLLENLERMSFQVSFTALIVPACLRRAFLTESSCFMSALWTLNTSIRCKLITDNPSHFPLSRTASSKCTAPCIHFHTCTVYTLWVKKTAPFYFCNIFVKPSSILIIFGTCIPW